MSCGASAPRCRRASPRRPSVASAWRPQSAAAMPARAPPQSRVLGPRPSRNPDFSRQKIVFGADENCHRHREWPIMQASMRNDFYLSDEQRAMRDLVRSIARERIAPLAAQVDETESYPAEQLRLLGQQGLMGLYIPEAYGGTGMGTLAFCLAVEEIAWACASTAVIYLVQYAGGWPIVAAGSEEQKRRYLPRLASGEITAAFSLSEPGAGSDAASISTRAVRKGDRYVLNGVKLWVTNGSHASVVTLFATVDRGLGKGGVTAFLVEPTFPGFTVGKLERKLGIRGSPTAALHLADCEVPVENRLGEEGEGYKIALSVLDGSRPAVGAEAVGI